MTVEVKSLRKRLDKSLRRALHYIAPVAKVVKEATGALGAIAKPTPITVINAVTSGLSTIQELVQVDDDSPSWGVPSWVERGLMLSALRAAGFREETGKTDKGGVPEFLIGDLRMRVDAAGTLRFWEDYRTGALELVRRALDAHLPPVMVLNTPENENATAQVRVTTLTDLVPPDTNAIADRSVALLRDHRAILLEGRPGVGKTTMAQAIARRAGLGRVLILENTFLQRHNLVSDMFRMLSLGVVIVDDIDKVRVNLNNFERLRESTRLLILTANNGSYDEVIDAALARPARIDEIFTVTASAPFQRPPFDQLTPASWALVSQWPQAYLNELELRLQHTPNDLRAEDLVRRMDKRTRSVDGLLGGVSTGTPAGGPSVSEPFDIAISKVQQKYGITEQPDEFDPEFP